MLNFFSKIINTIHSRRYVAYKGVKLPILRTNQGLSDNEAYLRAGHEQLDFLQTHDLITKNTRLLDFGCGQGRIANALQHYDVVVGEYVGLDTDGRSIEWCRKFIDDQTEKYAFVHLPAYNERYNTSTRGLQPLPFAEKSFDLIFLNSVFSHMVADDVDFYLAEFRKVLRPGGHVYLTAFVEEEVAAVEENPSGYISDSSGALHRVRYEKGFFFGLVEKNGLAVKEFLQQHIDRTKQSVVVLH